MAKYIDADRLKKAYSWWRFDDDLHNYKDLFDKLVDEQPAISCDLKQGYWIIYSDMVSRRCSICGKFSRNASNYCSNCGAKMSLEEPNS